MPTKSMLALYRTFYTAFRTMILFTTEYTAEFGIPH